MGLNGLVEVLVPRFPKKTLNCQWRNAVRIEDMERLDDAVCQPLLSGPSDVS